MDLLPFRTLVVLHSYHHFNTAKIADAIAAVLGAHVVASHDMDPALPEKYDLVGFGSGIDSGKHYKELLDIADRLPESRNKRAFVFSTSSVFNGDKINEDHSTLRGLLQSKGYFVLGELSVSAQ
jgi:flavodoxin